MDYIQLPLFDFQDEPHLKRCSKCGEAFPDTPEYFHILSAKQGLRPDCKACRNAGERARWQTDEALRIRGRERSRQWYANNPEKVREMYQRENAKPGRYEKQKQRVQANPGHYHQKQKEYRKSHRDQFREATRRYIQRHPEVPRAYNQKRRSLRQQAPGSFTPADVLARLEQQNGLCFWCSNPLTASYHVDHVTPLSRGGTNYPDNIVIACPTCNTSKCNRLPFTEWQPPNPLKVR